MEQEKKDGNYSLNTLKEIWKYDPLRLLDLGNNFQVGISQNKPEIDEEARAITNFEKLTEDRSRPVSHTLVDATRVLPDIIALVAGPGYTIAKKMIPGKKAAKTATKLAPKLVKENTSDISQAFNNSKLLQRDTKDTAAKNWVRNLYENEDAMHRVAGRKLTPTEIENVKKELPNAIAEKIKVYNEDVDKLKALSEGIKDVMVPKTRDLEILRRHFMDNKILTKDEWEKLGKNLAELPDYDKGISFSHINIDRILKGIPKDKHSVIKDVLSASGKGLTLPAPISLVTVKAADAIINDSGKTKYETNKELEMKPDYWTLGSEPTPVSDFIASVFNVDFDDPARFNKKDVDAFFEFLEDIGTIEPGIKDKWTPRQKVSVLREMMSDKEYGSYVKERWANSKHKKNWIKSYSGE